MLKLQLLGAPPVGGTGRLDLRRDPLRAACSGIGIPLSTGYSRQASTQALRPIPKDLLRSEAAGRDSFFRSACLLRTVTQRYCSAGRKRRSPIDSTPTRALSVCFSAVCLPFSESHRVSRAGTARWSLGSRKHRARSLPVKNQVERDSGSLLRGPRNAAG